MHRFFLRAVFGAGGPVFRLCRRLWRILPDGRVRWWHWNPWAPPYQAIVYDGWVLRDGTDRSEAYRIVFPESPTGQTILDVGCHFGFYCFAAASDGAAHCTGVDVCLDRICIAQYTSAEIHARNLEFVHADILDYELSSFDVVLCLNVLHHLRDMRTVDDLVDKLHAAARERLVLILPVPSDPAVAFERVSVGTEEQWWISPMHFEQKFGTAVVSSEPLHESCYGPGRALVTIRKQRATAPRVAAC